MGTCTEGERMFEAGAWKLSHVMNTVEIGILASALILEKRIEEVASHFWVGVEVEGPRRKYDINRVDIL